MLFKLMLSLTLATPTTDTLRLRAAEALGRAVDHSLTLAAADARRRGAMEGARAARGWRNPTLNVTAENLGAQYAITGRNGLAGTEGQATLSGWLPLGGDHGAMIRQAEAGSLVAVSQRDLADREVRSVTLAAIAVATRDRVFAASAREESQALERFAREMTLRAESGRSAGGEAARARLEATLAYARAARRSAESAASLAELRRLIALGPDTLLMLDDESCQNIPAAVGAVPEIGIADGQLAAARAQADVARARAMPDLIPQIGLRRSAGFSGLLLGFSIDLPVFTSGGAGVRAARAELAAVEAERADLASRIKSEELAARAALLDLESAGERFDAVWQADLDRALHAAQERYDAGEGTLAELLDVRRARLAALDEYETWRASRRLVRIRLARVAGAPIDPSILCDTDFRRSS